MSGFSFKSKPQKGETIMKRIAILLMAMGMSLGLAKRASATVLMQPQDDKMKGDSMAGGKTDHSDKSTKKKKSKKDKMSHYSTMSDQNKMDHPQQ
jgi:hypothetical protein